MKPLAILGMTLSILSLMGVCLYIGADLRESEIAKQCISLGAFEVRHNFYQCDIKETNYAESEDFN